MTDVSDKYSIFICTACNLPVVANPQTNLYLCKSCNNFKKFKKALIFHILVNFMHKFTMYDHCSKILTNDSKLSLS